MTSSSRSSHRLDRGWAAAKVQRLRTATLLGRLARFLPSGSAALPSQTLPTLPRHDPNRPEILSLGRLYGIMHRALSPALVGSCFRSPTRTHLHSRHLAQNLVELGLTAPESSSRRAAVEHGGARSAVLSALSSALSLSLRRSLFLPSSGCHKPWLGKMTASLRPPLRQPRPLSLSPSSATANGQIAAVFHCAPLQLRLSFRVPVLSRYA
ncbi:hypothetical protein L1887_50832 [Cichorium endivia]|nr:hypothetical protein L1887_50832 [Cichorium endivia]